MGAEYLDGNRRTGVSSTHMNVERFPRIGEKRFAVLATIVDHWKKASFGPTMDEIKDRVGLATRSSVAWHVEALLEDGLVSHVTRKHRTLRPTDLGIKWVKAVRKVTEGNAQTQVKESK